MAQALAGDHGWHVYPVGHNKAPLWSKRSQFPNGSLDASKNEATIDALWEPYPDALIAVRLDYSNLMAIDIDRHEGVDGMDSFLKIVHRLGALPKTAAQVSLSGNGFHGLFKAPPYNIKKTVKGCPGVDFLHHAYIVLNEWFPGQSPWEMPVAKLPTEWSELLRAEAKPVRAVGNSDDPIRDILPIDYVRDMSGLTPNRKGKVSCPGHEDWEPSLMIYDTADRGWFCYSCRRGGSIYDFAAMVMGLPEEWGSDSRMSAALIDSVWRLYERKWDIRSEY